MVVDVGVNVDVEEWDVGDDAVSGAEIEDVDVRKAVSVCRELAIIFWSRGDGISTFPDGGVSVITLSMLSKDELSVI